MGSFNTTCFASMQTIAPGDECFIFPIKMESGYNPVEISIGEEKCTPYGFTSSTCYANAFWQVAGRLVSAKYDDYGRFIVDETERNKFILKEIFNRDRFSNNKFYKTEQGENQYHDVPFDPEQLDPEDPFKSLEYIWEPMQEHRVFVRNYKGQPAQFQFAVISKAAADYLFNMVNTHKDWRDRSLDVELKVKEIEDTYKEWPREDLEDENLNKIKRKMKGTDFFFFRFDSFFERGEGGRSFHHWYTGEIVEEQRGKDEFTERTKEIIRDLYYERYVFSGLEWFNLKIMPIIYASQDYSNEIGSSYAKFVNAVSEQICKGRRRDEDEEED